MYNIKDIMVEVCDERFPAVNIHIPECYPELEIIEEIAYGIYFEMMFETGYNIAVFQEAAHVKNGGDYSDCGSNKCFIAEITHQDDRYQHVYVSHHCMDEADLARVLKREQKLLSHPMHQPIPV